MMAVVCIVGDSNNSGAIKGSKETQKSQQAADAQVDHRETKKKTA